MLSTVMTTAIIGTGELGSVVVLALRFTVLKSVIDELADLLAGKIVVVPSNPVSQLAASRVRPSPLSR
jgi:predicted dinucleotide-binding enzyme